MEANEDHISKKHVEAQLKKLNEVFSRAAIGDFSLDVDDFESDGIFTEVFAGVQIMLEEIRSKIRLLNESNENLQVKIKERTNALEEAQAISHIGSWEWDILSNKVIWSDELFRIFGLAPQEKAIDFEAYLSYIHQDDVSLVRNTINNAYNNVSSYVISHKINSADGKIKIVQSRGFVRTDNNKKPISMVGTCQDITDIKKIEEELLEAKQSLDAKVKDRTQKISDILEELKEEIKQKDAAKAESEKMAAILKSANDAIIGKTLDGIITSWNPAAQKLYGYHKSEIIGEPITTIVPAERVGEIDVIMSKLRVGESIQHFRTIRQRKDGSLVHVLLTISPIQNSDGEFIGASSIARDITAEVRSEETMVITQARLQSFMDAAKDAFFILESSFNILDLNNSGYELGKRSKRENMAGKYFFDVYPFLQTEQIKNAFDKVLSTGVPINIITSFMDDDFERHVDIDVFPLHDGLGLICSEITDQYRYEQQLEQSESKYRTLVDSMSEGILIISNEGSIQFVNSVFTQLLGFRKTELLGSKFEQKLKEIYDHSPLEFPINPDKNFIQEKIEMQTQTKSGSPIWLEIKMATILDQAKNSLGVAAFFTDITSRKEYEKELDAIAKFPEENPNPVLRFGLVEDKIIFANRAAASIKEVFEQDNKLESQWKKKWISLYHSDEMLKDEIEIRDQVFLFTMVPVTSGKYVNLYATDITSAKIAEREIARLLFVLSKTDNSIMIADKNGKIQWVNSSFEKMTGYTLDDVKGTSGSILRRQGLTGLNDQSVQFQTILRTKSSLSYEIKNFSKDGNEIWTLTTLTPVLGDNDEIEGIVAVDTDITAKKLAEKEMIEASRIAEESAKSKELFLANMSHEIRTPLNAILGIIQLLKDTQLQKDQVDYLKSMDFAGQNLLRIINDILDISKIESGKMQIENSQFNLKDVLESLVDSIKHRALEKQIDLKLSIAPKVPVELIGDSVRLNQILLNLMSNALKFTDKGHVALKVDLFRNNKDIATIEFYVEDTGIGIPKNVQQKVFEQFEQADAEVSRKFGGTGLGLSIVSKLIQLMNGSIEMQSIPNQGTLFKVVLNFEIDQAPIETKSNKNVALDKDMLKGKRILLVEDNRLNQMVATKFLQSAGIEVTVVSSGNQAIYILQDQTFDMILMDIRMPDKNGYVTTEEIRNDLQLTLPIVAMTANALESEKQKCFDVGMDGYLSKPIDKVLLIKEIEKKLIEAS